MAVVLSHLYKFARYHRSAAIYYMRHTCELSFSRILFLPSKRSVIARTCVPRSPRSRAYKKRVSARIRPLKIFYDGCRAFIRRLRRIHFVEVCADVNLVSGCPEARIRSFPRAWLGSAASRNKSQLYPLWELLSFRFCRRSTD